MRISDWSSDVCSSDLPVVAPPQLHPAHHPAHSNTHSKSLINHYNNKNKNKGKGKGKGGARTRMLGDLRSRCILGGVWVWRRSEERRVGKAGVSRCRSRWSPCDEKKKKKKE